MRMYASYILKYVAIFLSCHLYWLVSNCVYDLSECSACTVGMYSQKKQSFEEKVHVVPIVLYLD